jgi:hypothetical protein
MRLNPARAGSFYPSAKEFAFKYRPLDERALEIISKRELYFPFPSELNDPFDCDMESFVGGSPEQLEELWEGCLEQLNNAYLSKSWTYNRFIDGHSDPRKERNDHNFWRQRYDDHSGKDGVLRLIEEFHSQLSSESEDNVHNRRAVLMDFYVELIRFGKQKFWICSMAGDATNILMWSHYAANHTGFALVFDTRTRIFVKQPGISHHPVEYSCERKVNVAKEGWPGSFIQLYTRKAQDWAYERESRYVCHNGAGPKKFKQHTLRGIILGCRFEENFSRPLKRKLSEDLFSLLEKENKVRRSGSRIQIYLAQKAAGAFSLKLRRLHDIEALRKHFKFIV